MGTHGSYGVVVPRSGKALVSFPEGSKEFIPEKTREGCLVLRATFFFFALLRSNFFFFLFRTMEEAERVESGFLEHASFGDFSQKLFGLLLEATQQANQLPDGDDYSFYASFRPFRARISDFGAKLLDVSQEFLHQQIPSNTPMVNDPTDPDDVADRFGAVVDAMDSLLERVVSIISFATYQSS